MLASPRLASHRIASHRIASHRIASHRIASHRASRSRRARTRLAVAPGRQAAELSTSCWYENTAVGSVIRSISRTKCTNGSRSRSLLARTSNSSKRRNMTFEDQIKLINGGRIGAESALASVISGGKAAVAALVETIESGTFGAASILGFVVLPDQLQVFADLTHHPDFHVRRAAIRVLGKSGDRVGPTTRPCVTDCITAICPNSGQPKPGSDPSFCAASFYAAGVVPRRSPRGRSPPTAQVLADVLRSLARLMKSIRAFTSLRALVMRSRRSSISISTRASSRPSN